MQACGPSFCADDPTGDLACAVKRATVIALERLSLGVIRNADAINFVLEPLHARVEMATSGCDPQGEIITESKYKIKVTNTDNLIQKCPRDHCDKDVVLMGSTYKSKLCIVDGADVILRPALFVAECLVRSLFAHSKCVNIKRVEI
jgi:hypothetical protein